MPLSVMPSSLRRCFAASLVLVLVDWGIYGKTHLGLSLAVSICFEARMEDCLRYLRRCKYVNPPGRWRLGRLFECLRGGMCEADILQKTFRGKRVREGGARS